MNYEQLRTNIMNVIGNRKSIYLKVQPNDSNWVCNIREGFEKLIVDKLPPKYREHIVSVRKTDWNEYSYEPLFDTGEYQTLWEAETESYIAAKAEWCQKYGCE